MAYILYARDRSPGTLLDQTPTKKREGREGETAVKTQRDQISSGYHISKRSFPKHGPDLPVCRTATGRAGLVFYIPSKAHCLET